MTHTTGVLAWSLPAGIAKGDIGFISFWTTVAALVIGTIGVITLRMMAGRSVRFMVTGVVLAVSYTHSPSPRDATLSRMPSSA